eukprot:PhF_6_TR5094/c0_g1_i2/m.7168
MLRQVVSLQRRYGTSIESRMGAINYYNCMHHYQKREYCSPTTIDTTTQAPSRLRFAVVRPDLFAESTQSTERGVARFTCDSDVVLTWKCSGCGHTFDKSIHNRYVDAENGTDCPSCMNVISEGNDIDKMIGSELAKDWDSDMNAGVPKNKIFPNSDTEVQWKCKTCQHSWREKIQAKSACPSCTLSVILEKTDALVQYSNVHLYGSLRPVDYIRCKQMAQLNHVSTQGRKRFNIRRQLQGNDTNQSPYDNKVMAFIKRESMIKTMHTSAASDSITKRNSINNDTLTKPSAKPAAPWLDLKPASKPTFDDDD